MEFAEELQKLIHFPKLANSFGSRVKLVVPLAGFRHPGTATRVMSISLQRGCTDGWQVCPS